MPLPFKLCALAELDDPGSAAFDVGDALGVRWDGFEVFVVRLGDVLQGYINACPHTSGPLDWTQGKFLDADGKLIQCSTHHALFSASDGLCVSGPCAGQSLVGLSVEQRGDSVWLLGLA